MANYSDPHTRLVLTVPGTREDNTQFLHEILERVLREYPDDATWDYVEGSWIELFGP